VIYTIDFTRQALDDISHLKKSEPITYNKLKKLLLGLQEHPYMGTGKPEQMKYNYSGCYSRKISHKHRLVYQIFDEKVISAYGHYDNK
jgi:toxin YoeB